jgi:uncharacterized repeat protein (TIGR01451 family)
VLARYQASGTGTGVSVHTKITMTAPKKVAPGPITFKIKVTNTGSTDAHNVTVTDPVPPGVASGSVHTPPSENCTVIVPPAPGAGTNGTLVCDLGTVAHHAAATLTLTMLPPGAGPLTNTASVSTTDHELSPPSATTAKATVIVRCPPHQVCPQR